MNHLLLYPFAGAACGVLAAVVVVPAIGGNSEGTFGMTLLAGIFLAGSGAIAGALVGVGEVLSKGKREAATPNASGSTGDAAE